MNADEEIRERQARCQEHLIRLRMLSRAEAGVLLPQLAAAEVGQATEAVLAEVEAVGGLTTAAGNGRTEGTGPFLGVRLARLAAAADEAIRAALAGDTAALRGYVHRFDSLVSAIWVVQQALHRRAAPGRPDAVTGSRMGPPARAGGSLLVDGEGRSTVRVRRA
jgi:hypothetical protein